MDPRTLIQWNCRGYFPNIDNIYDIVKKDKPFCICLQELKIYHRKFSLPENFICYLSSKEGETGILINRNTPHKLISLQSKLSVVALTIFLPKKYTICSIYLPHSAKANKNELKDLLNQLPKPLIIVGDFNSRHPLWGDIVSTYVSEHLITLMDEFDLNILNDGSPTHYHVQNNSYTCIDLSFCSSIITPELTWEVLEPQPDSYFDSDHFPIRITFNDGKIYQYDIPHWNIRKADWAFFLSKNTIYTQSY